MDSPYGSPNLDEFRFLTKMLAPFAEATVPNFPKVGSLVQFTEVVDTLVEPRGFSQMTPPCHEAIVCHPLWQAED
jgi:hypothetical protein